MKISRQFQMAVSAFGLLAFLSCGGGELKINGTEGVVTEVVDGNTVRLRTGLTVDIYGIKDTEHAQKYLEDYVKGQRVVLRVDSRAYKKTYKNSSNTVRAYLKIKDRPGSVAGDMLSGGFAELEIGTMSDSLDSYSSYVNHVRPRRLLTDSELLSSIKPATFLIVVEGAGGSEQGGTGFFINENGLALTNNHVLNEYSQQAYVALLGENGQIDRERVYAVQRILHTVSGDKVDYTIFEVNTNGNEVDYIPLASRHPNDGERIAKLGCPVGQIANFQTGNLSNYLDGYFTHSISSNNGDSGGPVVNFYGEAVGINQSMQFNETLSMISGSLQKAEGIAYAVDIDIVKQWLDEHNVQYGR